MVDTSEKSGTQSQELRAEFSHRFEELMNAADGVEFALRRMEPGGEKEEFRTAAKKIAGLIRGSFESA